MPEYPDLECYREALRARIEGQRLERLRLISPFVLRTVEPPVASLHGKRVVGLRRLGKRLVLEFEAGSFLVIHLMVSGRLFWKERGAKAPGRASLAALDFPTGTLLLTEVSTKKRASLHVVQGEAALKAMDRGGLEVMTAPLDAFVERLRSENHTLKRALTDPRLFSGIGNAYSDEILHRARLSPVTLTKQLTGEEVARLFEACRAVLGEWKARLWGALAGGWPEKVTAFRPEMAVHGRHRQPCPSCGSPVQRIVSADNESNYCATCQTKGRVLADRALSRLLREDWPTSLDALEEYVASRGGSPVGRVKP